MVDIVKNQPGQCHHLHVLPGANPLQMSQLGIGRVEWE